MDRLHKLDEVTYVRLASVYRSFKDINEFMNELKDILSTKEVKKVKDAAAEKLQEEAKQKPDKLSLPLGS